MSIHGVLRRLGYTTSGGMFRHVVAHIRRLELDTSHFRGQAWARGMRRPRASRPLDELLVEGSTTASSTVHQRIIAAGLKWRTARSAAFQNGAATACRCTSTTSTATTPTTGSRTSVSCARTATPSPRPGAGGRTAGVLQSGREAALRTPTVRVRIPPPAPRVHRTDHVPPLVRRTAHSGHDRQNCGMTLVSERATTFSVIMFGRRRHGLETNRARTPQPRPPTGGPCGSVAAVLRRADGASPGGALTPA